MAKSGGKTTSPKAATAASKVLQDGRTGDNSKTAAGSALSQTEGKGRAKESRPPVLDLRPQREPKVRNAAMRRAGVRRQQSSRLSSIA